MFNRFTQSLIKMDERSQLEFLRKMVEGVLSLDTVMRAGELGAVNQLLSHGDQIGVLDHIVDAIDLRAKTLRGNTAGIDLVNQFQALSAKERTKQADTYIKQLQSLGKAGEHAHKQLMNILSKDSAIIFACNQLVAMFAYKLYCINDIDTSEQCEIITHLSENPECVIKSKHPATLQAVASFQKLYGILTHSYISSEVKEYIHFCICTLLICEVNHRTCVNKSIMTLAVAKVTLDRHMPENMSCSFFTKGKHESARTASRLIADLFKKSIHLCDLENVDQINNIRDTFIRVYALVAEEKSSFGKTTFWDDILDLMNHVLNQENHVLKMDKSSFASGRR